MRLVDAVPPLEPPAPAERPIRLVVTDDLERSRLTVFFRLFLAIPHLVLAPDLVGGGVHRRRSSSGSRCSSSVEHPARCTASSPPTSATRHTSPRTSRSRPTRIRASRASRAIRWTSRSTRRRRRAGGAPDSASCWRFPRSCSRASVGGGLGGSSGPTCVSSLGGAARCGRVPRLVRVPGSRAHAARHARPGRVLHRLRRTDVRVLPAPHRPLPVLRPVARSARPSCRSIRSA